jgi:hypothetical protein
MFKREINRRWGLTAARAWARLLIERIKIVVLGFGDVTELGVSSMCVRRFQTVMKKKKWMNNQVSGQREELSIVVSKLV